MKTDVEELTPTRVKLTVEVPFDEIKSNLDKAYKEISKQVRLKGFRPGKVPAPLIDRYVGRGTVLQEAVNDALPELYGRAVEDSEVLALGQPKVEITNMDDGNEFAFTAEVEVRPRFEVPAYDGLEVTIDDAVVTPDDVEEAIGTLRERFAALTGVDRPTQEGDFVSIDLSAKIGDEDIEDARTSGYSYEVGTDSSVAGLDDALVGLSAEESTTFTTTLVGGEHEGEDAEVTVAVHSVKFKELPELDDEFAQLASEFDTIGELRADIRKGLERQKLGQQIAQARDRALEALLDKIDIPLPDGVIQSEIARRGERFDQQLQYMGLTRGDYLKEQEKSEEEFDTEIADAARQAVKGGFVLDQLAYQEGLDVENDELSDYLVAQAGQIGVPPQQLARHLTEQGQIPALVSEVRRTKSLDLLLEHVKIINESGVELDLKAIQRELSGEDEAAQALPEESPEAPSEEPAAISEAQPVQRPDAAAETDVQYRPDIKKAAPEPDA